MSARHAFLVACIAMELNKKNDERLLIGHGAWRPGGGGGEKEGATTSDFFPFQLSGGATFLSLQSLIVIPLYASFFSSVFHSLGRAHQHHQHLRN